MDQINEPSPIQTPVSMKKNDPEPSNNNLPSTKRQCKWRNLCKKPPVHTVIKSLNLNGEKEQAFLQKFL